MTTNHFDKLDPKKFLELFAMRQTAIASAPVTCGAKPFAANSLAQQLHPKKQYMTITAVEENGSQCRSYILEPDIFRGSDRCAYFSAGQCVSVYLDIDGMPVCRPYTITSSPKDALKGKYRLTVKAMKGGLSTQYIYDHWKIGTSVELSDPIGTFTYEPLRDAKHIIGVAEGSGIVPFLSLAKAIAEGTEDCSLTLLYENHSDDDILMKIELDVICRYCDKVKVVYASYGDVTAEVIKSHVKEEEPYSVFICGSQNLYTDITPEIEKLEIERKYVRFANFGELHEPIGLEEWPVRQMITATVSIRGEKTKIRCAVQDTILQSLEKNGIAAPSRCRSGECSFCHTYLASGKVYVPESADHRRMADAEYGYIHPCCTFPLSDIEIEVPAAK